MNDHWQYRWGRVACVLAWLVILGAPMAAMAQQESPDFAVEGEAWNGLSRFVEIAGDAELEVVDTLDWKAVADDDVVVIIYPRQPLGVDQVSRFVLAGGRLLLADDFGQSQAVLERLSIGRRTPPPEALPHDQFVDDDRGWPRFIPTGRHPLLEGVDELVANHPAVLYNEGGPVVPYDRDGGLVYDMVLGEGRAVVVADPAIFINAMLPAADNERFANNARDYLCEGVQSCRIWLVAGDFEEQGVFDGDEGDQDKGLAERVDALNERLRQAFEELAGSQFLFVLAIFLALGLVAYLAVVFPWRRFKPLSHYIDRHRQELSPPSTEFDWNVDRFTDADGSMNYMLPMAILRESFDEVFLDAFGLWPSRPEDRPSMSQLARRFEERYLRGHGPQVRKERRREVEKLLGDLNGIPRRHHVFLESEQSYSARDLRRLYRRVKRVIKWMGLEESYERRSREINARRRGRRPRR